MRLWNNNPEIKKVNLHKYSPEKLSRQCSLQEDISICETNIEKLKSNVLVEKDHITSYLDLFKAGHAWVKEEPISELLKDIESVDDVHFVFNDTDKEMKDIKNKLSNQVMNSLLYNAKETVTIITPYLFPTEEELQAWLADLGIEIYLYNGPDTLHAKGAVIDHKISFIGSFNFDRKSANFNREIGIRVGNINSTPTQFSREFESFIEVDVIANSTLAAKDKMEYSLDASEAKVSLDKKKKLKTAKKFVGILSKVI
jgi:phosphatidylserine/phosphatidylglycerophosphate/cardiolipin synthase-like enzyme